MRVATVMAALAITALAPSLVLADNPPLPSVSPANHQTPELLADDALPDETVAIGTDETRRMTIAVTIDGHGPYQFIVDTGAHRSVIARELATKLALKKGRTIRLHTMTGVAAVDTVIIPNLAVNSLKTRKIEAPAFERNNIGAMGLVGIDGLQSRRVLMDFAAGTMTLTPPVKLRKEWNNDWEGETLVVEARRRFGQLIITKATVEERAVDVIIDTGLEVSVGNEALRRALFTQRNQGRWQNITLESVTGEALEVDYTTVDRLRIRGMRIGNLPIAFADAHPFEVLGLKKTPALLLGMDVLRVFDQVSIDFSTKEVGFRWTQKPKGFDMADSVQTPVDGATAPATQPQPAPP